MDPIWCTVLKQAGFCKEAQRKLPSQYHELNNGIFVYLSYQRKEQWRGWLGRQQGEGRLIPQIPQKVQTLNKGLQESPEYQRASNICVRPFDNWAAQLGCSRVTPAGRAKAPLSWQELWAGREKPGVCIAPAKTEHGNDQGNGDSSAAYSMSRCPPLPPPSYNLLCPLLHCTSENKSSYRMNLGPLRIHILKPDPQGEGGNLEVRSFGSD